MYKVYAIQYSYREKKSSENFFVHLDPYNDVPMKISYYVWLAVSEKNAVVIDTGFSKKAAERWEMPYLNNPVNIIEEMGVKADSVSHVIISHMHFDHIGHCNAFKNAKFVIQEDEMAFWTGKYVSRNVYGHFIEPEDVMFLVEENIKGNVHFVDGVEEILPGITVHKIGGHAPGLQVVKIETEKGPLVLTSDGTHYYHNINDDIPFPIVHDLAKMCDSFDIIKSLVEDENLIIPGHDPLVMEKFAPANEKLKGKVVRLA